MKTIRYIDLIETAMGPLEVETTTVYWWFSILTLGFFRLTVCCIGGMAYDKFLNMKNGRRSQIQKMIKTQGGSIVFWTINWRVKYWHKYRVKCARIIATVIDDYGYRSKGALGKK